MTRPKCVSLTVDTVDRFQEAADDAGITFSYLLEKVMKTFLAQRRKLTTD